METLEIHSKSYLVRWVHGDPNTVISWKILPEKRSINFGVFVHDEQHTAGIQLEKSGGNINEKLAQGGFRPITENGLIRIEGKTSVEGQAEIEKPVMLAFIFDNTFSISQNKHVSFWFSASPVDPPSKDVHQSTPVAEQHLYKEDSLAGTISDESQTEFPKLESPPISQSSQSETSSLRKISSRSERRSTISSLKSLGEDVVRIPTRSSCSTNASENFQVSPDGNLVTGYLQKKRRKKLQGYARRFFSLDKSKGLLSYYLNNRSPSLRGVMPMKIVEITTDDKNLTVVLDSGMEKWPLKAYDARSYKAWYEEIKQLRSSNIVESTDASESTSATGVPGTSAAAAAAAAALQGATNSPPVQNTHSISSAASARGRKQPNQPDSSLAGFTPLTQLRDYIVSLPEGSSKRSLELIYSSLLREAKQVSKKLSDSKLSLNTARSEVITGAMEIMDSSLDVLKRELYSNNFILVALFAFFLSCFVGFWFTVNFLALIVACVSGGLVSFNTNKASASTSTHSTAPSSPLVEPRGDDNASLYSQITDNHSPESSEYDMSDSEDEDIQPSSSVGDVSYIPHQAEQSKATEAPQDSSTPDGNGNFKGERPNSLYPLPHVPVQRRNNVPSPTQAPPSLMALLKKAKQKGNLGAPITTNEPLSGVQFVAELFENCDLLDRAAAAPPKSPQRTILVAVFLVARVSAMRIKERSLRKPFTPLLGESFEMVREDLNMRFVGEKVMHKPEVIATQTESPNWTVHFTSRPHTKMWAKSAQLTDVGTLCVTFPDGENVSFINPEMFIRNIIGGERYVEPAGTSIVESSAGIKATVEFKAGGMFSGRSENVVITCDKLVYEGKWTESISHGSEVIWKPKATAADPTKHYGWPLFSTQLNEITGLEQGNLPPNDSRLRPDLRLYEQQTDVEKAEKIKLELEQHQRERRAVMEQQHKQHEPFFFRKTKDAKGHYVLYSDDRNYWKLRENKKWDQVPNYFK